jgi:hypothetical protein
VRSGFSGVVPSVEVKRAEAACAACSGTGIAQVVTAAVALAAVPPVLVFPVADLATCQSIGWEGKNAPVMPLKDCIQVSGTSLVRHTLHMQCSRCFHQLLQEMSSTRCFHQLLQEMSSAWHVEHLCVA